MEGKNQDLKKEGPLNSFAGKHEYEEDKEAMAQWHTDKSINDKNPKSRNNYNDHNGS